MASDFQKDLYNKKGSSFSIWDLFIGLGVSMIATGLGLKAKEKYFPIVNGSKKESPKIEDHKESPQDIPVNKSDLQESNALGKLGL